MGASTQASEDTAPETPSLAARIAWYCVWLVVALVPLTISNTTWMGPNALSLTADQFEIPKLFVAQLLALVGLAAWSWSVLRDGRPVRFNRALLVMAGLVVWVIVSTVASVSPWMSLVGQYGRMEGLATWLTFGALFFLAVQVVDSQARIRFLSIALVVSASVAAVYGVAQYVGVDPLRWGGLTFEGGRAFSTLGNPDPFGGFLALVLPVALALALAEQEKRWLRLLWWASFVLVFVTLIVTFTRGAWLGAVVGLAVLGFAAFRLRVPLLKIDAVPVTVGVVAGGAVVARSLASSSAGTNVAARLGSIFDLGAGLTSGSGATRSLIAEVAVKSTAERPIFGAGPDTFKLVFARLRSPEYVRLAGHASIADNAHSYPLQLASTLGVPGLLLFLATVALVLFDSVRGAFEKLAGADRILTTALWAACLGYLVYLSVGVSEVGSVAILWVMMGSLTAVSARELDFEPGHRWALAVWPIGLACLILAALAATVPLADHAAVQGLAAGSDSSKAAVSFERATQLAPWSDFYASYLAAADADTGFALYAQGQQTGEASVSQQAAAILLKSEQAGLTAVRLAPGDMQHVSFLVTLYTRMSGVAGPQYLDKAISLGQSSLEEMPRASSVRYAYAVALATKGDMTQAEQQAAQLVAESPTWAEPHILLGDIYRVTGRLTDASREYQTALSLNDPTLASARVDEVKASLAEVEQELAKQKP